MKSVLYCSLLMLLLLGTIKSMAQKTSAIEPRLVKELRRAYNSSGYFSAKDSAVYTYSADHAWDSIKNDWKYDVRTDSTNRIVRAFNADNRISIENYQKFDRGFWWPDKRMLFEYHNNKVIRMTYQEWLSGAWENLVRYDYSYDALGNRVVDMTMIWEPAGWQNSTRQVSTYSSMGVAEVVHEKWIQNSWEAQALESFVYVNGKKAEREVKVSFGGWNTVEKDFFFYNSKGNDSIDMFATLDANNEFDTTKYSFHYNGNNRQDTILQQRIKNGTDSNISKTLLLYYPDGWLGLKNTKYWNDVSKIWYYPLGIVEYLYEYEQVAVAVNDMAPERGILELYPVPAGGNELVVRLPEPVTEAMQVSIYSVAGKHMQNQAIVAGTNSDKLHLDISGLPAGNYVLTIGSGTNRRSKAFTVER